jgi:hypothetical protein
LGWLWDLRSDMPFVRLFPCDIVKPQSGGATFYSLSRTFFLASSLQAVSFLAGGDGGRRSLEQFARAGLREHYQLLDCTHSEI